MNAKVGESETARRMHCQCGGNTNAHTHTHSCTLFPLLSRFFQTFQSSISPVIRLRNPLPAPWRTSGTIHAHFGSIFTGKGWPKQAKIFKNTPATHFFTCGLMVMRERDSCGTIFMSRAAHCASCQNAGVRGLAAGESEKVALRAVR